MLYRSLALGLVATTAATYLPAGSPFEWAGTFAVPPSTYTWLAERGACHYADASMQIVVLPITAAQSTSESALVALEAQAAVAVAGTCTTVANTDTFTASSSACYQLNFAEATYQTLPGTHTNGDTYASRFNLAVGQSNHVAIFTEHLPTEFEVNTHYLQDYGLTGDAQNIEPIVQAQLAPPPGAPAADPHAGHNHGRRMSATTHPWEWAGTFETPLTSYFWQAEKNPADYADASMQVVLFSTSDALEATLEGLESAADTLMASALTCPPASQGATLTPVAAGACYTLTFDCASHTTTYTIDTANAGHIAIFGQHVPIEFERDAHYLKDVRGGDVEPVAELPHTETTTASTSTPWGVSIGAAFIVNLMTLAGVVLMLPCFAWAKKNPKVLYSIGNSFAAGAILACTFYLLLFEATHLVFVAGEEESLTTANWGSMILAGIMSPFVLNLGLTAVLTLLGKGGGSKSGSSSTSSSDVEKPATTEVAAQVDDNNQARVLVGVLLGDFMHNFVDGIFIGAAFAGCGNTVGWTVTSATVAHELAQEISDFVILTDPQQGKLKPIGALVVNFLSGLSVVLGVVVILSQDVSNWEQGMLLAYGGGVYIHIAAAEAMPRVYYWADTLCLQFGSLISFIIGAIAIGLVLLDHEHCFPDAPAADGAADPHAGHNHGRMLAAMLGM